LELTGEAGQVVNATGQPIELHAGDDIEHSPARIS